MKKLRTGMLVLLTASLLLAAGVGCAPKNTPLPEDTESASSAADTKTETETETETESESETETERETEPPLPDNAERLDDPDSQIDGFSSDDDSTLPDGSKKADAASGEETNAPQRIYSYITGKTVSAEEQKKRPLAIMINNIEMCLPQNGISAGDMFYECSAEGGITRLMMLTTDYASLPEIGSVRSSRDYFVDFLANHDAIYAHAGGSAQAYAKIAYRKIDNLDGVNMYLPDCFYRDMERWNSMGMEHSLMTTGERLEKAITDMGYRTTLAEDFQAPFVFYDEETDHQLVGSPASHVHMVSTPVQTVDFVYDEKTGEYLRYQYNGKAHVDGANNQQLSFKNILILFTDIHPIPEDNYGRLAVGTIGNGQGYYITNGKRKVINWSRDGKTTPVHLEYRNGDELLLNCGKTFICVVDNTVAGKIDFQYQW